MKKILFILTFSLMFTACSFKPSPMIETKDKYALVIGNNSYQETPLRNALIDAIQMKKFLRSKGFNVTFLQNGTTYSMRQKINQFINKLSSKSVALVYYSGHGTQEKVRKRKRKNYLIPINNKRIRTLDDLEKYAISLDEIIDPMRNKNQGLNIVILDACRNSMLRSVSRSLRRGLAPTKANGVFIAYATESGETASDSGLFRKSFIKYAKQNLEIVEIFDNVRKELQNSIGQTPFIYNDKNGNFKFSDTPESTEDTDTPQIYNSTNKYVNKYAFYGRYYPNRNRWRRYFNIISRKEYKKKPRIGDILKARGGVNIRSGAKYYDRGKWVNLPIIGGIHKGNTIVVKEVKEVAPNFFWIGF